MKKIKLLLVKIFKIGILIGMFGLTILGAYKLGKSNVISVEATIVDSMPEKIEELKDSIVDRLVQCESAGKKDPDGLIIFDSNKVASIGRLQFQVKTIQHYVQVISGKEISSSEAIALAINGERAEELAKRIIFDTKSGVISDWTACSKRLGLQSEVDIIKKISN